MMGDYKNWLKSTNYDKYPQDWERFARLDHCVDPIQYAAMCYHWESEIFGVSICTLDYKLYSIHVSQTFKCNFFFSAALMQPRQIGLEMNGHTTWDRVHLLSCS